MSQLTNTPVRKRRALSPLPSDKSELRDLCRIIHEVWTGNCKRPVTLCPVAVAPGASFGRNQHPRSGLRGAVPPVGE